jgi:predicted metalloprotease
MRWLPHGRPAARAAGRRVLSTASLLLAVPGLAGCAGLLSASSTPGSAPAPVTSGIVATQSASRVLLLQQGDVTVKPPAGFSCSSKSLRGCFNESDMATYFEYVLPIIDKFYETTLPSVPLPAHVYFIPDGVSVKEACGNPQTSSNLGDQMSYEYCPADDNVYIGQHMAFLLYSLAGDVAPATGLAHEFGHNVQSHTGVPAPQTNAETRVHENQADCISGAWLGFANDQHLLEQGDVPVLQKYLELIASSENDPNRTHGDFAERGHALETGGEKGLSACNAYYPNNPITTS